MIWSHPAPVVSRSAVPRSHSDDRFQLHAVPSSVRSHRRPDRVAAPLTEATSVEPGAMHRRRMDMQWCSSTLLHSLQHLSQAVRCCATRLSTHAAPTSRHIETYCRLTVIPFDLTCPAAIDDACLRSQQDSEKVTVNSLSQGAAWWIMGRTLQGCVFKIHLCARVF